MIPVHTTPPTYCGLLTVAVTVTSVSSLTRGAVHVVWNLPFASVAPVRSVRVPIVAARLIAAPWTAPPPLSDTTTWTVVVLPEVTDFENVESAIVRGPSWGCWRAAKDHTLFIPPNESTQPENEVRSNASSVS